MSRERILEVALTMLGAALLLVAAVGKHPYGFYMVLRLVITVGAVYWAWRVYKAGLQPWTWAFVVVALLLNPFVPIRMQRAEWQPIDLCLGIFLIAWSGYWLFRKRKAPHTGRNVGHGKPIDVPFLLIATYWLWLPLLFFCLSKVLPGHIGNTIAKIMFAAWAVIFVLAPLVGFIVLGIVEPVINFVRNGATKLVVVHRIVAVAAVAVALVVGVNVLRWTGEAFRAHTGLFLLLLAMMVLATGALARFVGKLPYRNKVKVIWLGLICYLSFMSLAGFDVVRD
jgi:hypothetical protein